jgi:hypothetical protein
MLKLEELENKVDNAFTNNLKVDINSGFKRDIDEFKEKLAILANTGRFNKLVKSLLKEKDRINFNSFVFEVSFAYDFESKCSPLQYEVTLLKNSNDTIDFLYKTKNRVNICFDLHQANQRKWLTDLTKSQLKSRGMYEIVLDGQDEQNKIIRLQNLVLSKCQDKNGKPCKFIKGIDIYNIIVIYVSGEIDGHFDKFDCMLTMYGDPSVPIWAKRNIFGLCQQLPVNAPEQLKLCHEKFEHFNETINGVLFVKNASHPACYGDLILNLDLEYFLVGNNNLSNQNKFNEVCIELQEILKSWTEKKAN